MTKVTILGADTQEEKTLKPIEAVACIQTDGNLFYSDYNLKIEEEVFVYKLPPRNPYGKLFDCIIINNKGEVFVGHFNDGVV